MKRLNPLFLKGITQKIKTVRQTLSTHTGKILIGTLSLGLTVIPMQSTLAQTLMLHVTTISPHSCVATNINNDQYIRRYRTGLRNDSPTRTLAVTCAINNDITTKRNILTNAGLTCADVEFQAAVEVDGNPDFSLQGTPEMKLLFEMGGFANSGIQTRLFEGTKVSAELYTTDPDPRYFAFTSLPCQQTVESGPFDLLDMNFELLMSPILYVWLHPGQTLRTIGFGMEHLSTGG